MQNQTDVVTDCTSQVFEGLITLQNPKASWVAKWQRLTEYCEGVYATKVVGIVSFLFFFFFRYGAEGEEREEERGERYTTGMFRMID